MFRLFSSQSGSLAKRRPSEGGFSLVELLVSVSILVLITSASIARFSEFDSAVLLRNAAYKIAVVVREAQTFSLSVSGAGGGFDVPYGVTFTPYDVDQNLGTEYTLFRYTGSSNRPRYDVDAVSVETIPIGQTFRISDICVDISSSGEDCNVDRLDVSFERPEFDTIFYAEPGSIDPANIESARIHIAPEDGSNTWVVEIGLAGQVSVTQP